MRAASPGDGQITGLATQLPSLSYDLIQQLFLSEVFALQLGLQQSLLS